MIFVTGLGFVFLGLVLCVVAYITRTEGIGVFAIGSLLSGTVIMGFSILKFLAGILP